MNFLVSVSLGEFREVCRPAGRPEQGKMFSFSHRATSHWEEDGSNYQCQQLREGQASAHQSALLHHNCACVRKSV